MRPPVIGHQLTNADDTREGKEEKKGRRFGDLPGGKGPAIALLFVLGVRDAPRINVPWGLGRGAP